MVVVLTALLVAVGAVVLPAGRAVAAQSAPASCGVAQLAPVLQDDEVDAAPSRARVPVVVVHGWLGTSTHDEARTGAFSHLVDLVAGSDSAQPGTDADRAVTGADQPGTVAERSVIGTLQDIEGSVVYTFDYRDLSARWVTDPGISDALASSLACLVTATGNRAIVVAHSMGGLAARQALSQEVDGVSVESLVSDVITFGTPNTGSDLAARLGEVIESTGSVSPAVVAGLEPQSRLGFSALLASCGEAASEDAARAGECTGMPMIDALSSQAGIAMRTGSSELSRLPPWPAGVHVVALAGDIRVTLVSVLGARTRDLDLGDVIVGARSAEAGVDEYEVSTCRYTLMSLPDVPSVLAELSPLARVGDAMRLASVVTRIAASPCHHAWLMRNTALAERAGAEAADAVAATLARSHGDVPAPPAPVEPPPSDEPRRRPAR
ncbi:hypothetical protein B0T42_03850 [Rathayibacter sp. VKM Ac-2630]|nr:hypothetical protein B0T42_03850 [Rathayibacter sp. VKM Ac-2630]